MSNITFNNLPIAVQGTVLTFIPDQQYYPFALVSTHYKNLTENPLFIASYFTELSKELGQERLG